MRRYLCRTAVTTAAWLFAVLGSVAPAVATGSGWSRLLPEHHGIQQIVVGGGRVYVLWADKPVGHTAALSQRTGKVLWRAKTAPSADLLAAGDGVLWSAQNLGSALVEQRETDGEIVARFTAPGKADWRDIAATGEDAYGLTEGAHGLVVSAYRAHNLIRRVSIGVPNNADCRELVGSADLYVLCFENRTVMYRLSESTGRILARAQLPANTVSTFAYEDGSIYVEHAVHGLDQTPRTVLSYSALTLRRGQTSRVLNITGDISATGHNIVVQATSGKHGAIITLDPARLTIQRSIAIPAGRNPGDLVAGGTAAYLVVSEHPEDAEETVLSVPL